MWLLPLGSICSAGGLKQNAHRPRTSTVRHSAELCCAGGQDLAPGCRVGTSGVEDRKDWYGLGFPGPRAALADAGHWFPTLAIADPLGFNFLLGNGFYSQTTLKRFRVERLTSGVEEYEQAGYEVSTSRTATAPQRGVDAEEPRRAGAEHRSGPGTRGRHAGLRP